MAIPDFQTIMLPFVQTLEDSQTWTMKELTERLALHFNLSESERHELLPSGQQTIFSNRVAWAKSHLKNAGLIANPSRGKVTIYHGYTPEEKQTFDRETAVTCCRSYAMKHGCVNSGASPLPANWGGLHIHYTNLHNFDSK